jgi:hypothetical protein
MVNSYLYLIPINFNLFHEYPYLITINSTNLLTFNIISYVINTGTNKSIHLIHLKSGKNFLLKEHKIFSLEYVTGKLVT